MQYYYVTYWTATEDEYGTSVVLEDCLIRTDRKPDHYLEQIRFHDRNATAVDTAVEVTANEWKHTANPRRYA